MRVGAGKKPGFFSPGGYTCRPEPPPGSPPEPRPGTPARKPPPARRVHLPPEADRPSGHTAARKPAAATGHTQPPEARRPPAGHTARPETGPAAGAHRRRPAVPGEGVVRSPCVPGGDRAPLTREFPTNSGVGVSAPKGIKKTVPKDGEGDDGMRLLSDVGLVAAGGLIWNPHNDQPLIQRGKQIQFAEVIPRF